MLVFIDESGDAGLKLDKGSSDIFVVTLVIFFDNEKADMADQRINELREEMRLHPAFEFKFNKLSSERRKLVLRRFVDIEFQYHSIVIHKNNLQPEGLDHPESFYKFACSLAFEKARYVLSESVVVIDGSGSKEFRRELQRYLKSKMNYYDDVGRRCIAKVKMNDSSKNNLLQLADLVCGSVSRSYKDKADRYEYRNIIKRNEGTVENWPK